jgi:hypothetical protein
LFLFYVLVSVFWDALPPFFPDAVSVDREKLFGFGLTKRLNW